ncbi:MAG: hypothetical protein GX410_01575 [Elusimicrobia bacterium]|nr:hypothetical protein [Elusimicrobiota bacterium]
MDKYASSVTLTINGQAITDFKSFSEGQREVRKEVKLMGKTGYIKMLGRYKVTVEYVVPENKTPVNWDEVEDATLLAITEDGRTISFTGVSTLSVGETKFDGENDTTQTIELMATGRK